VYASLSAKGAGVATLVEAIQTAANKKLYSALLDGFFSLLKSPELASSLKSGAGDLVLELFEKDLVPEASKVNPVRFMEFVGLLIAKIGGTAEEKNAPKNLKGEAKLEFLAEKFAPFKLESDEDDDGDVEMGDGSGEKKEKKAEKPKSRIQEIGKRSHYHRAAEKDFQDCKALFMSLKVELLVALAQEAAAAAGRGSGSGSGFFGSLLGSGSSSTDA